ncbi:Uncharacterised protein [uncultured archaeon]|nr:Uncharacterised protein [uncultured archaeon]
MEQRDILYLIFWSFAASAGAFFLGFGEKSLFLFALSLTGIAFAERMERSLYAVGSVFLALAFAVYFGKSAALISQVFIASLLFLLLPFLLLELRKIMRK